MIKNIYSADADFQWLETLRDNRNKRHAAGTFLVEGVRNINCAVAEGWTVRLWVYDRERALSGWAKQLLSSVPAGRWTLSPALMEALSGRENTSELLAVVEMRSDDISRLTLPKNRPPLVVVFDRPSNKGNLGALIRSAEALGADGLITTGHCADLYDRETLLATMGSFFALPALHIDSLSALTDWYAARKAENTAWQCVGTSAHGSVVPSEVDFSRPTLLLIGNETYGLSRRLKEMSDALAVIPMVSGSAASSLNVACAASILLYEITRQRR
ncbi:MAG: TrmH family RNA methyltransferase [Christensenellales bacterium]